MNSESPKTPRFQQGEHVGARRLNNMLDDLENRQVKLGPRRERVARNIKENFPFRVVAGWTDGYQAINDIFVYKGKWTRNGIALDFSNGTDHPEMPTIIRYYQLTTNAANSTVFIGLRLLANDQNPDLNPTSFEIFEDGTGPATFDVQYARNNIRWIARIKYGADVGGYYPILEIEQLDFSGDRSDNVILPNEFNWDLKIQNEAWVSKTITFRPSEEIVNSQRELYELQLHNEHNYTMFPPDTARLPFAAKNTDDVTELKWGAMDGSEDWPLTAGGDYCSLQIREDASLYYYQLHDFYSPAAFTMDATPLVCVRNPEGAGAKVRWCTMQQFGDSLFGSWSGTAPWTETGVISHHELDDLTTYDDHDGNNMKYANLGEPNAYGRNTADTPPLLLGGSTLTVKTQGAIEIEGTGDFDGSPQSLKSAGGAFFEKSVRTNTGDFIAPTGHGLIVNGNPVVRDRQATVTAAAAVAVWTIAGGSDQIDLAAANFSITSMIAEINSIKDQLNDLINRDKSHGLIAT